MVKTTIGASSGMFGWEMYRKTVYYHQFKSVHRLFVNYAVVEKNAPGIHDRDAGRVRPLQFCQLRDNLRALRSLIPAGIVGLSISGLFTRYPPKSGICVARFSERGGYRAKRSWHVS